MAAVGTRKIEARDMSMTLQPERDLFAAELTDLFELVSEDDCRLVVRVQGVELELDETIHELVRKTTMASLLYESRRLRPDCSLDASDRTRFEAYVSALEIVHPLGEQFPGENWLRTIPWRVEIVE